MSSGDGTATMTTMFDGEDGDLVGGLQGLGDVMVPGSIVPLVLAEVGLADAYAAVETAIGAIYVAFNRDGISAVRPAGDAAEFEAGFRARFGRGARALDRLPTDLAQGVEARLRGDRQRRLRFDLRGLSTFEQAVLTKAGEIPRGQVRPYGWVAREIGRPEAVRAVGTALGRNPVPLLIPCHRVVRGDGRTGGYVFGPEVKRAVLATEGVEADRLEGLARSGVHYYGSDTTGIYCFPTCRYARRVMDRHRVPFASTAAATLAGYRPCKVCRPAGAA